MKPDTLAETESASPVVGMPFGADPGDAKPDDAVHLESCSEHEWIVVTTRGSVYDLIVLSGKTCDVMVRGGRFFPEFRRASVTGSLFGDAGLKLGSICVGMCLALDDGEKPIVTSRIRAICRRPPDQDGAT